MADKFLTESGLVYYDKRLKQYISDYVAKEMPELDTDKVNELIEAAIEEYLASEEVPIVTTDNIQEAITPILCTELITEGAPADSKAVGDAIAEVEASTAKIMETDDGIMLANVDIIKAPTDISELI